MEIEAMKLLKTNRGGDEMLKLMVKKERKKDIMNKTKEGKRKNT